MVTGISCDEADESRVVQSSTLRKLNILEQVVPLQSGQTVGPASQIATVTDLQKLTWDLTARKFSRWQ